MNETALTSFDHHDADQMADPYPAYESLRRACPVAHTDRHGGAWVVSRFDDVVRVAGDHAAFRSGGGIAVPPRIDTRVEPQESDPPRHTQVRAMMVPWFSPGAVSAMGPMIRAVSRDLLDGIAGRHELDLAEQYARPLAAIVMLRLLGFPEDLEGPLQEAIDATLHAPDLADQQASAGVLVGHVAEMVAQRRRERAVGSAPGSDLLTRMLDADIGGQPTSEAEAISFTLSLVFAGFETSANTLATAAFHLERRPDLWTRLRHDPELLPSAIEELLRYISPVQAIGRVAVGQHAVAHQDIADGDVVVLLYGSANHDAAAFEAPDELDLARPANRHVAFGSGIHRCVGRHLARLELRVALTDLLTRIVEFEVTDPDAVVWGYGENRGVQRLPLRVNRWA